MRRNFLVVVAMAALVGCDDIPSSKVVNQVPTQPSPQTYDLSILGRWDTMRVFEIKNRKTGKVHVVLRTHNYNSESMIKLEEWMEDPEFK